MNDEPKQPFDYGGKKPDGQHERHPGIEGADKAEKVRPVRRSYKHLKCGIVTQMPAHCAETYAVNPKFYASTFCCGCGDYFPVGDDCDFVWVENDGSTSTEKVGA